MMRISIGLGLAAATLILPVTAEAFGFRGGGGAVGGGYRPAPVIRSAPVYQQRSVPQVRTYTRPAYNPPVNRPAPRVVTPPHINQPNGRIPVQGGSTHQLPVGVHPLGGNNVPHGNIPHGNFPQAGPPHAGPPRAGPIHFQPIPHHGHGGVQQVIGRVGGRSQLPFYRHARWAGGAVVLGAGAYYYLNPSQFDTVMLPDSSGVMFDIEEYIRSLDDQGLPPDGALDPEPAPNPGPARAWGALSYSSDGAGAYAPGQPNRQEAIDAAVKSCKETSGRPNACNWAVAPDSQYVVALQCSNDQVAQAFNGTGTTAKRAISDAYKDAVASGTPFEMTDCKVRKVIKGDGTNLANSIKEESE